MVFKPRCDVWKYFDNIEEDGYASCKLCKQQMKNNRTYCLRQHLKTVHNTKSKVWKYFDDIVGEGQAECKECKQRVRSNRTSNFTRHMEKYHNIVICDVGTVTARKSRKKIRRIEAANKTGDSSTKVLDYDTSIEYTPPIRTREIASNLNRRIKGRLTDLLHTELYKRTIKVLDITMDEKIIKSAVWGLMIDEGVAPSLFGSKNMQGLIKPICEAISTLEEKEFKIDEIESERVLYSVANKLRNDISNELRWRLLSLKIDMDLRGPERTFCISISFVHEGSVQTRSLGIIDLMNDPHLTEQHIKRVIHKFDINCNQIIYACWNNTKSSYDMLVKNSMYLQEICNFEKYPTIRFSDIKIERYVGDLAHLCLLDLFKNSDIFQPFLNCRNFVKFLSNELNGYYEVLRTNKLNMPKLDSPWKWGSTYQMLQDLNDARIVLENEMYPKLELLDDQFSVNDNFWLFVDAFCVSLKFVQKAIIKYHTEELHFGDWYAQWLKSKLLTAKVATKNNTQNKYLTLISSHLMKSIEIRTKDVLSKDVFQACLYVDPRFQHTLSPQERYKAAEYLKKLWNRAKVFNPEVQNDATDYRQKIVQTEDYEVDEDAFLNEFLCQSASEAGTKTLDVYTKIEELKLPFKSVETNILLFWNKKKSCDPEIFSLSAICLAIPTTQIYNKNLYTHIEYQGENNLKLQPLTKDILLSVRLNYHLIEDALELFGSFHEDKSKDEEI